MKKYDEFYRYKILSESLEQLDSEEKKKLYMINSLISVYSHIRMAKLSNAFNFKRHFALIKYKNYHEFANDELFKASEEITRLGLVYKFKWLKQLPLEYFNIKQMSEKEVDTMEILINRGMVDFIWNVIWSNHLAEEYLDPENKSSIITDWKDFDKVVELVGLFRWIGYLKAMIEANDFEKEVVLAEKFPALPLCFKDSKEFTRIFSEPRIADLYDFHDDGTYHWRKGKKVYLACIAQRLLSQGKLIELVSSNQDLARVFCPFFNISFDSKYEKQFSPDRIASVKREFEDFVRKLIK